MGVECQGGNDHEHEEQMINTLIKNIQLESPATESLQKGRAPTSSLGMLPAGVPGNGRDGWGNCPSVRVAPPTPESTPVQTGRALPRPLSADMLAAGDIPISQQQRAATPTAQTNAFSDSPQATSATHGIVLLPGTNIPAHLQETLNSPQKGQSVQSPQRVHSETNSIPDREGPSQSVHQHNQTINGNGGYYQQPHGHTFMNEVFHHQMLHDPSQQYGGIPSDDVQRFHQQEQMHLQHMTAIQQFHNPNMYPVWDGGQLVGYVRVGDQSCPEMGDICGNNTGLDSMYHNFNMQPHYMQQQGRHSHQVMDAMYLNEDMVAGLPQSDYASAIVNQQRQMRRGPEMQENQKAQVLSGICELSDLIGRVVDFSRDQEGSRFIQKQLSHGCDSADRQMLFDEVLPRALELVCDVFGNYVVQKLLETGTEAQVEQMSEAFKGHILELSLQTYGCRVVQKALDVMTPQYKEMVATELRGSVPKCVQDQNGNHVIQKCIETMPNEVNFIVSAFKGNVQHLATHAYGCRVIQRLLEHCKSLPRLISPILDEILGHVNMLVTDQYGNYVVQDLLIHGDAKYRYTVSGHLRGSFCELSKHKYASNVVEKIFQYGTAKERFELLDELMGGITSEGYSPFLCMVKDQYANYVVQKLLDLSDDQQRAAIINHIQPHSAMLRKFTYGKHIMSRIDRLLGLAVYDDEEEGGEQMQDVIYADPMMRKL